jgi:hypothetical protein
LIKGKIDRKYEEGIEGRIHGRIEGRSRERYRGLISRCTHVNWYIPPVHRQNVEVKNADGKKRRWTKHLWKKRRLGQNVEQ